MSTITTTFSGNLTEDPVLRFTSTGKAVANFRVAVNNRIPDGQGGFTDRPEFISVVAWQKLGEHVAASLRKGNRVLVTGSLRNESYTAQDGSKRYTQKIHATDVGASLMFHVAGDLVSEKEIEAAMSEELEPAA